MELYNIDDKNFQTTSVPRADDITSYIEKQIKKLNTDLKTLEKKRAKIVSDFGESYASDIDNRIKRLNCDIKTKTEDSMISRQIDTLLQTIIQSLNVTYKYGLLSANNGVIEPFRPSYNYSIYEFNSGSRGRLAIVQNGFKGFSDNGDHISIDIRYRFSNRYDATVMKLEWCTKKNVRPNRASSSNFDDSVMVNIDEYDEYQVAEFRHAIDIVSRAVDLWYPTYVSVEDAEEAEEKRKMERRMAYTAAILTDTCVDSVEE